MESSDSAEGLPWSVRVAGVVTLLVGAANVVVAVVATAVPGLSMEPLATTGLVVAGAVTAWLGWRILQGTRWALPVTTVLFAALLLARSAIDEADAPIGIAAGSGPSEVLLVVVVAVLGVAIAHQRHRDRQDRP